MTVTIATFVYVFTADANGTVWAGSVPMMQLPPEVVATTTDTTYSEDGYQVEVSPIWETTLETPLYDTEPHLESKSTYTLTGFGWDRPYPGTNGPLIPGDPEREAEAIRSKQGIPLLKPVVDEVLPLAEAGRAHEKLEARQAFGKLVLVP